jgi:uncharacterized protein YcfJ
MLKPTLAAAITISALLLLAAAPAIAQPPGASWNGDVCHEQKQAAAAHGTFLGAIFGGIFGAAIAPHDRAAGAVVGGTAGAVTGHVAGADSIQCLPYPPRVEAHEAACQWVSDSYDGAPHEFEVCKEPDGVWRPSGRS